MGKYSNVNVNNIRSTANAALNQLQTHENNLENIYNSLNDKNNFNNSNAIKLAKDKVNDIYTSSSYNGTTKKIEKYLKKLLDGLEYIEKYQEAEKKYKAANVKVEEAQRKANSSDSLIDDGALALAKASRTAAKAEMDRYESLADSKFN